MRNPLSDRARARTPVHRRAPAILLMVASLAPLLATEPAASHEWYDDSSGVVWNNNGEDCIEYGAWQDHYAWVQETYARWGMEWFVPGHGWFNEDCGQPVSRNREQIWSYVTTYKNGDGAGGYECWYSFGWAYNLSNGVTGMRRDWVGGDDGLAAICGWGGWYTIDADHWVYFDGPGWRNGIIRAATGHWY